MEYYNEITFEFPGNESAIIALEELKKVITKHKEDFDNGYLKSPSARLVNDLTIKGNTIMVPEWSSYFSGYDSIEIFTIIITELAESAISLFTVEIRSSDTYEESYIEANYQKNMLTINTDFYPMGYSNTIGCGECGKEIMDRESWHGNLEDYIICPSCGEKIPVGKIISETEAEHKHIQKFI